MKKLFPIVISLLIAGGSLNAQLSDKFWWFDAGFKVQYGATGFLNSAIQSNDNDWNYEIGTGLSYGLKLGINKGYNGFTIDVMRATAKQPFENSTLGDPTVEWRALDLYTLYRNNRQLGYFEIGPKFSFINEVSSEEIEGLSEAGFSSNVISGVVGFGAYFIGSGGRFSGILGLRFEYGLTDMVDESIGREAGLPVLDPTIYQEDYAKSNPVMASIVFELNWGIGYYGKSSCGGRSKFIML